MININDILNNLHPNLSPEEDNSWQFIKQVWLDNESDEEFHMGYDFQRNDIMKVKFQEFCQAMRERCNKEGLSFGVQQQGSEPMEFHLSEIGSPFRVTSENYLVLIGDELYKVSLTSISAYGEYAGKYRGR